jgi:hypothetical protein
MAQHGYLHENYDSDDFGRGEHRDSANRRGDWQGRERGSGGSERERDSGSMFGWREEDRHQDRDGSREQHGSRYSVHPDDHYRSWRDKQMQALDREYADYCREREQQFHRDFDSWRQNRQRRRVSDEEVMELDNPAREGGEIPGAPTSPMGAATLGTNDSENDAASSSTTGRRRR